MKYGKQVQITIEERNGSHVHVVWVDGVELEGVISTRILDDPSSKFIPDGCVRITIDVFATLTNKIE